MFSSLIFRTATGSPKYHSLLASNPIERSEPTEFLTWWLVFGLNIKDDLSLLITYLEDPSYTSKIPLSSCASLTVALINIKESSAKNGWFTLGAPREILMPSILPSHSAFYSIVDMKKSISPHNLWGLEYITPQPMKQSISPLNFSKPVKLPPKAV